MKPISGTITDPHMDRLHRTELPYPDAKVKYDKARADFADASAEFERNATVETFTKYCDATEALAAARNELERHTGHAA